MERKKSIANYLGENSNRFFKIPAYQRGYKWGVKNKNNESAVELLCKDIMAAMQNNKASYFIQGVTVYEKGEDIILIDGQQRTTTLFLILNLLFTEEEKEKYLFFKKQFKLKYEIRESSQEYLKNYCKNIAIETENTQDIYYFKQAIEQIQHLLPENVEQKQRFKEYILNNVMLFYIQIPENQATNVFSMMNGAKAFMKTDELIKAGFLSEASKNTKIAYKVNNLKETFAVLTEQIGEDWKANALRSQYARQWDKWLYWWNKEEVQVYFDSKSNPLGLLLAYFYESAKGETTLKYTNNLDDIPVIFKAFQNLFIQDKEKAIHNFEKLRKLQKKFEDIYNNPITYNYLGLALETSNKEKAIRFFIDNFKDETKIKKYTLVALLGKEYKATLTTEELDDIKATIQDNINAIAKGNVYEDEDKKELAFKMLFKLNIEASNTRKVKFDFYIIKKDKLERFYKGRSLEHIWPKSKIAYKRDNKASYYYFNSKGDKISIKQKELINYLKQEELDKEELSVHHIGNLVFLHKDDNSVFSNKLPEDKKKVYFNLEKKLYSRNLLHTMSVFAYDSWSVENAKQTIKENQTAVINQIKIGYEDYIN